MHRYSLLVSVLIIVILLFTAGCGQKKREKNTLRYWLREDPPSLDPAQGRDTTSAVIQMHIYDGLVDLDPLTVEPVPAVAEKWDISEDGLVYTFHLRKGVKFHNGREVTAEDFRYSFERVLDPKTKSVRTWVLNQIKGADEKLSSQADTVEGIKVIDNYTLELTLKGPLAFFVSLLAMEAASVIPQEEVGKWGLDFHLHPVGCGPFKFVLWERDKRLILEANKDYYGEGPYLDKIKFLIHRELSQAVTLYKAGKIDILTELPPGTVKSTSRKLPDEFLKWDILGTYYLAFNLEKPPFKDNIALRRAFNHAVNKRAICEELLEGIPYPAKGILPKGLPGYNPDLKGYDYNPEKAKELLAEAGYPNGEGLDTLELWYNTNEAHEKLCTLVGDQLSEIGVNVVFNNQAWATYLDATKNGEALFFRAGWLADISDPDNFLYVLLNSNNIGEGNYARYANPEYDALVEKARQLIDMDERIPLYQKAEQMAVDDAVWLFFYHYRDYLFRKPYVKGVVKPVQGDFKIPLERIKMDDPR